MKKKSSNLFTFKLRKPLHAQKGSFLTTKYLLLLIKKMFILRVTIAKSISILEPFMNSHLELAEHSDLVHSNS